jgi:MoxR-like ATPase
MSKFVFTEEIQEALEVGRISGKNVLLYGPPGHAKSEYTRDYLESLADQENIFIQSFGEGMSEDRLWGGVDLNAMEKEGAVIYHTNRSFLNYEYAIFEELLDAPPAMLLSLKDTLTSGCFNNGAQRVKMKTKFVVGITNKSPSEMNDLGESHRALMERFPIKLEVKWKKYTSKAYRLLIESFTHHIDINISDTIRDNLSTYLSQNYEKYRISPRTVCWALEILAASARVNDRGSIELEDFGKLKFIEGFEELSTNLEAKIERAEAIKKAEKAMNQVITQCEEIAQEAEDSKSPIHLLKCVKRLEILEDMLSELQVPDSAVRSLENVKTRVAQLQVKCVKWAKKNTRMEG